MSRKGGGAVSASVASEVLLRSVEPVSVCVCVFEVPAPALNTVRDVCISEWGMTGRTGALSVLLVPTHTYFITLTTVSSS